MADELWYMQFDVTRWQRDMDEHSLEIKGAWITICCKLWWASKRGELTLRPERWAVILRMDLPNTNRILDYLLNEEIASGKREANGYVTLMSRKILKDNRAREFHRLRQLKYRLKQKGDASVTDDDVQHRHAIKSKSKSNKEIKERGKRTAPFIPPCLNDVSEYCKERKNGMDAQLFLDHYTSNGWMVGKNKMRNWKASVRTWEKRNFIPTTLKQMRELINVPKEYQSAETLVITEAERIENIRRVKELASRIG